MAKKYKPDFTGRIRGKKVIADIKLPVATKKERAELLAAQLKRKEFDEIRLHTIDVIIRQCEEYKAGILLGAKVSDALIKMFRDPKSKVQVIGRAVSKTRIQLGKGKYGKNSRRNKGL